MANQTEQTNQQKETSTQKQRLPWLSIGILCSAFAFVVLIAAFYAGYTRLISVNTTLASVVTGMSQSVTQNQQDVAALQKTVTDIQQNAQQWHDELTNQQKILSDLRGTQKDDKEKWGVAEAQYLVQLANDNLLVGDNVPLVITLLQTADQKLRDLSDPRLLSLRKALTTDITSLQSVSQADLTGIYLRLSALNNLVDKLPLPNRRPAAELEKNASNTASQSWWRRGLSQSWEALRQIVIVRYNASGVQPFVTPEQQDFLYQNMHAALMQAMFAVMHKQPEIYHANLQQALTWTKQYFLQDSPVTQAMQKDLTALQAINIHPALPPISTSLQAFRDYANQTLAVTNRS
jgi:uroporphyrin-3 C-methyltransferase